MENLIHNVLKSPLRRVRSARRLCAGQSPAARPALNPCAVLLRIFHTETRRPEGSPCSRSSRVAFGICTESSPDAAPLLSMFFLGTSMAPMSPLVGF